MQFNSISRSKLHCCVVVLILFILVFLSLPLLLINLANTRYEDTITTMEKEGQNNTESKNIVPQQRNGTAAECPNEDKVNEGKPVQCPDGTTACASCPQICVKQNLNCDGISDCPDSSDESQCLDTTGLMGTIFKQMNDYRNLPRTGAKPHAKPESCEAKKFEDGQCPCNLTEANVVICDNFGLRTIPNDLLPSVFKIMMNSNSIQTLEGVSWPRNLSSLVLENNNISRIGRATFKLAPNLLTLYLSNNSISELDDGAFEFLRNLSRLHIDSNRLTTFSTRLLYHTPSMTKLYLSANLIDLPPETRFSISPKLQELLLDHNQISTIKRGWFSQMSQVAWISLTHNKIGSIETGSFEGDYDLQELNLSFNQIKVIDRRIFAHRLNIQRLYLSANPISTLPVDAFRELMELESLNLTQIEFISLERETFNYLRHLRFIYFEKFRFCHYAPQARVCRPITDGLSTIEELLAFPILKYAVWIVALVCSLGNVFVLIWRSISTHEDCTMSLFIKNLSIADLMMGIYLSTIGWQDWQFQRNFRANAIDWMSSWKCTAIGFLAILSSELSVSILTIITIERYRSIVSKWRFEEEDQKRRARLYVTLAWLFSFLVASYPLIGWFSRNSDYYATNGLCLPLHIDQPYTHGWQYSAFVYLGINFIAVIIIIVLYALMYMMIIDGHKTSKPALFKAEKREETILAIRFFFIVVIDCLSWIPIVVIKLMALSRVSISAAIYGWLVVFIIPINSALNPIVYTLAAPTFLRSAVWRIFSDICYAFDRLVAVAGKSCPCCWSDSSRARAGKADEDGRRRRKTGSNSTSAGDTFDTSITSNSKSSFESTLLMHQDHRTSASCSEPELGEETRLYQQNLHSGADCASANARAGCRSGSSKKSSLNSISFGPAEQPSKSIEANKTKWRGETLLAGFECDLLITGKSKGFKQSASRSLAHDCITSLDKREQLSHRVVPGNRDELILLGSDVGASKHKSLNQVNCRTSKRLSFEDWKTCQQQSYQVGSRQACEGVSKCSLGQLDEITMFGREDKTTDLHLKLIESDAESLSPIEGPPKSTLAGLSLIRNGLDQAEGCGEANGIAKGPTASEKRAQPQGRETIGGTKNIVVSDNVRRSIDFDCDLLAQKLVIPTDLVNRGARSSTVTFKPEENWPN